VSWERVTGIFRRHYYVFRRNPAGIFDLVMWPSIDLLVWGMLMVFIQRNVRIPVPVGFLMGGVILWTLMFRSNIEMTTAFLDDTSWTRNIINLLVTPMRPIEYLAGSALWGLVKIALGSSIMSLLAWILFKFGVITIGPILGVFVLILGLFGLAMALLVIGIVLRFGHGADILAWGLAGIFTPLSAVWYPVAVMPAWAQKLALSLPPAHVFEALRAVLRGNEVPWSSLVQALGLNVLYVFLGLSFAGAMFSTFRRRGFVTRYM
jgi:ABC-type multidrug transport system permease subunit